MIPLQYLLLRYADSGQSNSLIVEEEGEGEAGDNGGLEAMVAEFNSGRWGHQQQISLFH